MDKRVDVSPYKERQLLTQADDHVFSLACSVLEAEHRPANRKGLAGFLAAYSSSQ